MLVDSQLFEKILTECTNYNFLPVPYTNLALEYREGTIIPLNYYALGNSGGESIFYAENGI